MLSKFSCRNYRSIGTDPISLDMVASTRIQMHADHIRTPLRNTHLLRNTAIYGANAAGKSTVLRALNFMKMAVSQGALPPNTTRDYCRAGEGLDDEESVFETQFVTDGRAYDYGFSCILGQYRVVSEWLYELGGSDSPIFERTEEGNIVLGELMRSDAQDSDITRFQIYQEDFTAQARRNPALLFLTSIGQGKQFSNGSKFDCLESVLLWFTKSIQIMGANQPFPTSDFYMSEKSLDEVAEVLGAFDTGISKLAKKSIDINELEKYVEFGVAMGIKQILAQAPRMGLGSDQTLTIRSGNAFVGVEVKGHDEPRVTILTINHQGSLSDFEFGDESDGTKRLFDFMDILFSKRKDSVFVVDEIDRSLHPMLTQQLIELFNRVHRNDDCQLVFTTHENDIMSYKYFRKDEIWFIDRDDKGFSRLYPLDDFEEVRTDSRISKRYLEGRYGGVPVLSFSRALTALEGVEE